MHKFRDHLAAMTPLAVLLPGLALVVFNSITGHQLYHVNTLKLFLLGSMLTVLWGYSAFFHHPGSRRSLAAWQWGLLLFLPTLGFLPGGWFNPEDNVYFPIELVTDLLIVGWAVLLVRQLESTRAIQGMLLWVVLVTLIVALWLANQGFGRHPLTGELIVYSRPEGSFGNVNYLASFLSVLTPTMVLLALPEHVGHKWKWGLFSRLCALGAVCLIFSALLAYSRAAIAATLVATLGSLVLVGITSPVKPLKRLTSLVVLIGVALVIVAVALPFIAPELLEVYPHRFAALYEIRSWWGRLVPVRGAVDSILASPLIGWGLGGSYNLNFTFLPTDADLFLSNLSYNHLHNEWLEMGQEGGLLGWLVWGGVMATLVIALLRFSMRQHDHLLRFLALGIIGGLAAFYTHGFFSVAQRMIVGNLPLYTLIGLAGAMLVNERSGEPWFDWEARVRRVAQLAFVPRYLRSWQVALVGLLVMWLTFYPWIRSFGGMVQLNSRSASLEERRDFFTAWPNPYGLSDLLNAQIGSTRFSDAIETGRKLDAIIPNYRNLPARLAEAQLNLGNIDKAKELLLKQHGLSNYLPNSNLLLAAIALYQGEKAVFRGYLEALITHALVFYHADYDYPDQVEFNRDGEVFRLIQLPDARVAVSVPDAFIEQWFTLATEGEKLGEWIGRQIQALATQPYFLPKSPERNRLVSLINQLVAEPGRVNAEVEKKRKAYRIANQGRNKGSFAIKADLHRIGQETGQQSLARKQAIFAELDRLLASAEITHALDGQSLFGRIDVLQRMGRYFTQVAQIAGRIAAKKRAG